MKLFIKSVIIVVVLVFLFQEVSFSSAMKGPNTGRKVTTNTMATGTSEFGNVGSWLVYVMGQPSMIGTSESNITKMILQSGYIYTLSTEAIDSGNCPYVHLVKINGVTLRNGDYLGPGKMNTIYIEPSAPKIITCEAWVDANKLSLTETPGTPYTTYTADFVSPSSAIKNHYITVFTSTDAFEQGLTTYEVQVVGGSVKTMDRPLNYPNPFSPGTTGGKTTIMYSLNNDSPVTIYLYDITGQEIKRWGFASSQNGGRAGINSVEWDGATLFGGLAGNGMYIYKITSKDKVIGTGKIVILD